MAKFTVKGVEFDFDIFDADNAELYENGIEKIRKETEKTLTAIKSNKIEKPSKLIRKFGDTAFRFIDSVFGKGKSHELFGDKVHLIEIANTLNQIDSELTVAINADAQQIEVLKDINKIEESPNIKVDK